jgi:multidrug efflux pump
VVFSPYLGYRLLDPVKLRALAEKHGGDVYDSPFYRRFRALVVWCLRHRWWVIIATVVIFVLSLVAFNFGVQKQFFPAASRPELLVDLWLPQGASLKATEVQAKKVEQLLLAEPEMNKSVKYFASYIGNGSPRFYLSLDQQLFNDNFAQLVITTHDIKSREDLKQRLEQRFAAESGEWSGLRARVLRLENGPPVGYPVQFRISGEDIDTLRKVATQVAEIMRQNPELSNINFDWRELSKAVEIEIDQDKARLLGVSSQDIAALLNMSLNGYTVTSYREGEKTIDVVLRGEREERTHLAMLPDLSVPTRSGKSVSLAQIATIKHSFEPGVIWRRDRLPTITVRGNLYGKTQPATIVDQLNPEIAKLRATLPAGYQIATGGSVEESSKGSSSVMAGIPLFLLAVITVLMIQLQSVSRVIMVLLTAPLGIIGIALFLLGVNQPFGFMALLGTIALFGMIMRNSVILVDQIEQDLAAGKVRGEAIVESTVRRFRPIVLTAAAAVLAMIPLSRNDFFGPMAVAIMGGLIIATALTLLFLPALYAAWYKVKMSPA